MKLVRIAVNGVSLQKADNIITLDGNTQNKSMISKTLDLNIAKQNQNKLNLVDDPGALALTHQFLELPTYGYRKCVGTRIQYILLHTYIHL